MSLPVASSQNAEGQKSLPADIAGKRASTSLPAMFASPKRRKVERDAGAATLVRAAEYVSIRHVHCGEHISGDALVCEAFLLALPDEPMWIEMKDRRTHETQSVPVVTCLLADRDGPMLLELWRDIATVILSSFRDWERESSGALLVEVRHFRLSQRIARRSLP